MHDMLQNLGMTDLWINVIEIMMYVILITSGLIAIFKQSFKAFKKLRVKLSKVKGINDKLAVFKGFSKWYVGSVKDGTITDEEITLFDNMFQQHLNICQDILLKVKTKETTINNAYVDSSVLDSDGDD